MARPSAVRTGMFCKFGSTRTAAQSWWRRARRRCARAPSRDGCKRAARRYRCSSAWRAARQSSTLRGRSWPSAASSSSAAASVLQAPVLVRRPPGRLILSNRISPSCLGEPILKSSPASSLISSSSRAMVWAKDSDKLASVAFSTFTPRRSICGENGRKRPLQRLIDRGDGFGREPRFQDHPEPQADIGLLAGIFGGARHLDAVERDRVAARAHDLLLGEAGIREETAGEFGGQMLGASGVERIGHQAGIVDGCEARCRSARAPPCRTWRSARSSARSRLPGSA